MVSRHNLQIFAKISISSAEILLKTVFFCLILLSLPTILWKDFINFSEFFSIACNRLYGSFCLDYIKKNYSCLRSYCYHYPQISAEFFQSLILSLKDVSLKLREKVCFKSNLQYIFNIRQSVE